MLEIQRKLSKRFFGLISLPATAMGFALSAQISGLSWLLSTKYNLNIHQIGIVWAAGPLAGIFGQVIVGLVSDRVWFWGGRRRPFILVGGGLAALMLYLLPRIGLIHDWIQKTFHISMLVAVAAGIALTLDLAINVSFNPTRSLIADVTPEGEPRTQGYTWMQTISGLFGVMAYVVGALFGNEQLIHVGVFVVLAFSILPTFFIQEPRHLERATTASEARRETATDWKQLGRIYVAHAFAWVGVQAMFVYIIAYVQQHFMAPGMSETASAAYSGRIISISFAILNTVGFLLPALVLDPLSKKVGLVKTHIGAVTVMAGGYLAVAAFGKTELSLYALMAVIGVGWGAIVSLPFAIMSEKVQKTRMGFFMGVFNLSVVLPQLFVSLVLGKVIMAAADKSIIFWIAGGTLAASAALWTLVREPVRGGPPFAKVRPTAGQ